MDFSPNMYTFSVMTGTNDGDTIVANEMIGLIEDNMFDGIIMFNISIEESSLFSIGEQSDTTVFIIEGIYIVYLSRLPQLTVEI